MSQLGNVDLYGFDFQDEAGYLARWVPDVTPHDQASARSADHSAPPPHARPMHSQFSFLVLYEFSKAGDFRFAKLRFCLFPGNSRSNKQPLLKFAWAPTSARAHLQRIQKGTLFEVLAQSNRESSHVMHRGVFGPNAVPIPREDLQLVRFALFDEGVD